MFKKILRCLIAGRTKSKRKGKQSKRPGEQNHPQPSKLNAKNSERFTQTTPAERKRMFDMRQRGQSVHAIARALGRSSRTVHQVLTQRGTQPLPEPEEPHDAGLPERAEGSRRKNQTRRQDGDVKRGEEEPTESFLREFGPTLNRMAFDVIKDNDEYILQFFGNQYGMKIPKKTIDDIVHEEIRNNPDLKRQVADDYLVRRRRMGRTETEIAGEVLDLAMKFADIMVRGRWTDVAEKAVTSGEIRKIIEVLRGRQSPESESLSRPTLAQHPVRPADTSTLLPTKPSGSEQTTL